MWSNDSLQAWAKNISDVALLGLKDQSKPNWCLAEAQQKGLPGHVEHIAVVGSEGVGGFILH